MLDDTKNNRSDIVFYDPGTLKSGNLCAHLVEQAYPVVERQWVQSYGFELRLDNSRSCVGTVNLRVQTTHRIEMYAGHIGYWIEPYHRGSRYAEQGVRLVLPLARRHGISTLWITCNPENWASRKTCERLGAILIEIVNVPKDDEMYQMGDFQKCRYRLEI